MTACASRALVQRHASSQLLALYSARCYSSSAVRIRAITQDTHNTSPHFCSRLLYAFDATTEQRLRRVSSDRKNNGLRRVTKRQEKKISLLRGLRLLRGRVPGLLRLRRLTKEGHVNPDAGRVGNMWVMILAIVFSLIGQYYLPVRHLDYYAFNQGCDTNACKGAAAVYRVSCCTAIFFVSNATVGWLDPSFPRSEVGREAIGMDSTTFASLY